MKPAHQKRCAACLLAAAIVLLGTLSSATAHANWTPDGVPVCTAGFDQSNPAICTDGAGGSIVAWTDIRGGTSYIYAQRFNASGAEQWMNAGVRVNNATATQEDVQIVAAPGGGAILVWEDYRFNNWDIYAQMLTASGSVATGWPAGGLQLSTNVQHDAAPQLVSDGAGGAIVVWEFTFGPGDTDIYAIRVTPSGTIAPGWSAGGFGVTTALGIQQDPRIAEDGAGGAFIVWQDAFWSGGVGLDVTASRVTASGAVAAGWGVAGNVVCVAANSQVHPEIAHAGADTAIVVWEDGRNTDTDIFAQRMDGAGNMLWGSSGKEVCVASGYQRWPLVCPAGDGGAFVGWLDPRTSPDHDVYAQRMERDGSGAWGVDGQLLCGKPDVQALYDMTPDGLGGALLVWEDYRAGTNGDIFAQHVTHDGQLAWPLAGLAVCENTAQQQRPVVTLDGAGGAIIAWMDDRLSDWDIYAWQGTGFSNLGTFAGIGWSHTAVPRNALAVGLTNVTPTPTLDGNANTTYLNWLSEQDGPNPTPEWSSIAAFEGGAAWRVDFPDSAERAYYVTTNVGPNVVRGGRHTVHAFMDYYEDLPESNESDNFWSGQWVWSPLDVQRNSPVVREVPPPAGLSAIPNCDGMQFVRPSTNYAWVVSLAGLTTDDDYELYVYDDYEGSSTGFSNLRASSTVGGNQTEIVVGHFFDTPDTVFPGAVLFAAGGGGDPFAFDASDANGHQGAGPTSSWLQESLAPFRLADVYEGFFQVGEWYSILLYRETGPSDLAFAVFPPTPGGIWSRPGALHNSAWVTADTDTMMFTVAATGWHPIVVYRGVGTDAQEPVTYDLFWNEGAVVDVHLPDPGVLLPDELAFGPPMPNPTAGAVGFSVELPVTAEIDLALYDVQGRRAATVHSGRMQAGYHHLQWSARNDALGAGVYFASLLVDGKRVGLRRVVVLR